MSDLLRRELERFAPDRPRIASQLLAFLKRGDVDAAQELLDDDHERVLREAPREVTP